MVDENLLSVTLAAYADLIDGNTIFINGDGEARKELDKKCISQIKDLFENNGKKWKGFSAFYKIKKKYILKK